MTTPENMIERVQRALIQHRKSYLSDDCACLGARDGEPACPCKMRYERSAARAAIAAMREPTEAMTAAARSCDLHGGTSFREQYEAAIDAALKE